MSYTRIAAELRKSAFATVTSVGAHTDEHVIDAADRRRTLAAERAMDAALADSFPASDPPSWMPGVARPQRPSSTSASGERDASGPCLALVIQR